MNHVQLVNQVIRLPQTKLIQKKSAHIGVEAELGQVVSWGQLPRVLQVEAHRTGVTLRCGDECSKRALCETHWAIIDLETSDWERPEVDIEMETTTDQ